MDEPKTNAPPPQDQPSPPKAEDKENEEKDSERKLRELRQEEKRKLKEQEDEAMLSQLGRGMKPVPGRAELVTRGRTLRFPRGAGQATVDLPLEHQGPRQVRVPSREGEDEGGTRVLPARPTPLRLPRFTPPRPATARSERPQGEAGVQEQPAEGQTEPEQVEEEAGREGESEQPEQQGEKDREDRDRLREEAQRELRNRLRKREEPRQKPGEKRTEQVPKGKPGETPEAAGGGEAASSPQAAFRVAQQAARSPGAVAPEGAGEGVAAEGGAGATGSWSAQLAEKMALARRVEQAASAARAAAGAARAAVAAVRIGALLGQIGAFIVATWPIWVTIGLIFFVVFFVVAYACSPLDGTNPVEVAIKTGIRNALAMGSGPNCWSTGN